MLDFKEFIDDAYMIEDLANLKAVIVIRVCGFSFRLTQHLHSPTIKKFKKEILTLARKNLGGKEFKIVWSEEDKEWVGLAESFPSLSWLAPTPSEAFLIFMIIGRVNK